MWRHRLRDILFTHPTLYFTRYSHLTHSNGSELVLFIRWQRGRGVYEKKTETFSWTIFCGHIDISRSDTRRSCEYLGQSGSTQPKRPPKAGKWVNYEAIATRPVTFLYLITFPLAAFHFAWHSVSAKSGVFTWSRVCGSQIFDWLNTLGYSKLNVGRDGKYAVS